MCSWSHVFAHIWTEWGKREACANFLKCTAAIDKRSSNYIVILGYKPHNTTMTIIAVCLWELYEEKIYIFISLAGLSSWKWVLSHSLQCLCCFCFGISLCIELFSLPGYGFSTRVPSLFLARGGEDTQNWASYLSSLTFVLCWAAGTNLKMLFACSLTLYCQWRLGGFRHMLRL